MNVTSINPGHPLRRLFHSALEFGCKVNPPADDSVADYIEEHILCGFVCTENLFRIRDSSGRKLDDIADMLDEETYFSMPTVLKGNSRFINISETLLFLCSVCFRPALKESVEGSLSLNA